MFWNRLNESQRTLFYSATVIGLAAVALIFSASFNKADANSNGASIAAAPSATFAADAGSLGPVPDGPAAQCGTAGLPKNVTFTVSGLSGTVSTVEVSNFTMSAPVHTWRGDLQATLIAPSGASFNLFGRTNATTATACGSSNDFAGPYAFGDTPSYLTTWWTAISNPTAVGSYRTTSVGGSASGGAITSMNPAFTGVTNANGTWTLRVSDFGGGDTGSISAATLNVTTAVVASDANVDMNGDGKTDFVVARGTTTPLADSLATGSVNRGMTSMRERLALEREHPAELAPAAPPIYWYTQINGSASNYIAQFGDAATDFLVPEDFDGDGKDDFAVWRPGAPATLYIFRSSDSSVSTVPFGQSGDDPAIMGDYDGDGKADPAVFRCPALGAGDGQCYYFYMGSNANPSGNITYIPWGFGEDGDFFPNTGDFDGDGKNDFCLQRADPSAPTQGQFVLLKSNGLGVEYINWGLSSDFIIPGDYDGDGKADFCVRRTVVGGARHHYILERDGGGTGASPIIWGITGDTSVPGDYDGDGKQDIAIWRGNADPTQNFFWILRSSDGGVDKPEWGMCPTVATCDYAVANWYVH